VPPPPAISQVATPTALDGVAIPSAPTRWKLGLAKQGRFWTKLAAATGPGYLIAVGYMDPGNWATDIAGGSKFGYALLPIIVVSNIAAMFLQWLALRLGIASGRDLAQLCGERYSKATSRMLWVASETAIIACVLPKSWEPRSR
jgi:manganese transport protein